MATQGEECYSTRLIPEGEMPDQVFSVFLVEVKSESEIGKRMLVVSRGVPPGETPASTLPLLEAVAKAVVAKLK